MSAAERAKARREAILNRGQDRLAKLTTSARGEDHPVFRNDFPASRPSAADKFTGEEESRPTRSASISPAPPQFPQGPADAMPMPSQQEFLQALMQSALTGVPPGQMPQMPSLGDAQNPGLLDPSADPLAQMLAQMTRQMPQGGNGPNASDAQGGAMEAVRPKTLLEKVMPLIHLIVTWSLLAYFAVFKEPEVYDETAPVVKLSGWQRWAELGWRSPSDKVGIISLPSFIWAFVTLLLVLHSMRIVTRTAQVQLPSFLTLLLMQLPPQFMSIVTSIASFAKFGSSILDDIAGLILGFGFLVWIANWFS